MSKKIISFVDLFAGIGGFHKALDVVAKKNNLKTNCVFVSEIDQEAIKTYENNFNITKEEIKDIKSLNENASLVPEHDFLFAGFPCQTFSNAGKKMGFLDEIRGTLFFDIVKILKNKKPAFILLENVKHLVNHDNKKTWNLISKILEEDLGYIIPEEPLILSPHQFGIPQERQRVFIPGFLKSKLPKELETEVKTLFNFENNQNDFLMKNDDFLKKRKYIFDNFLEKNIEEKYFLKNSKDSRIEKSLIAWGEFVQKVKRPEGKTLPVIWLSEFGQNYSLEGLSTWRKKYIQDMREIYDLNKEYIDSWMQKYNVGSWNKREQKFEWQAGKDIQDIKMSFIQLRQSGIRCKRPIKFPTLVAMVQIPIIFDDNNQVWRYLTPRETSNLQSFPKNFKTYNELSHDAKDFFAYKQLGNSVNLTVVSLILEKMVQIYLKKEEYEK